MYHARAEALATYLAEHGVLTDPRWREALHEVPRHHFVPARAYAASFLPDQGDHVIDKSEDPAAWAAAVYQNYSIVTQRDDGAADPADPAGTPSCSLSCPWIAMEYLHLLALDNHHRVLEIGTGTGWTAGMLGWRTADRVTTMEVDKKLADVAVENLAAAGRAPLVVTGDGADGHPDRAPYDRVHVTVGVRDIPLTWVEQCRPGGQIVLPWMPIDGAYGQQLVLDAIGRHHARGRFAGGGGFMMMRSQRHGDITAEPLGKVARRHTRMDPRLIADADGGAQLVLAARLPELTMTTDWVRQDDGTWAYVVRLADLAGTSRATCTAPRGADEYQVEQSGDRELWAHAEAAYLYWLQLGRPGREHFGLTLTPDGQRIWLENPDRILGRSF